MNELAPPLPPIPAGFRLPFFYGALHNIGIDYLVPPERVNGHLAGTGLSPALLDGKACVSFNYQLYFAQFDFGPSVTQEIELNIIAFPTASSNLVPELTYRQFAQGEDQTKLRGNWRIQVACDAPIAIRAGKELFNEPKFPAWFKTTMPSPNADPSAVWQVECLDASLTPDGNDIIRHDTSLFSFKADLSGLLPAPVSMAPFTEYGTDANRRTLAAPLNVYQNYQHFAFDGQGGKRVSLTVDDAESGVGADLKALLKDAHAVGAWSYQSPIVAAQNRPYYSATKS
ncbi:hypothetical protein [Streptacidiphilus neutrinimicus]|uniref:hypothetical protein n=1 Tax=Streptacidiphilus neutrinimicus TaxID=105420 RepID=UPI00157AD1D2|nr:hypothetical protein [Streptacidiphilus neutrinimicus]